MELVPVCKNCKKPKAPYICGLCAEHVCKSCTKFMDENSFSFEKSVPAELKHSTYCPQCFDEKVSEPLSSYESAMEKARELIFFSKNQSKQTGKIKRKADAYQVTDCEDEQETILRLAFYAVRDGYNCLLDLDISHRKIVIGSHKKTVFSGTAFPVSIDTEKVRDY